MPPVIRLSVLLLVCAAACLSALAQQTDRPPWARNKKAATTDATAASSAPASDPEQDRNKIKIKVDLVNVLVSVLDDHNRPAPDLPK